MTVFLILGADVSRQARGVTGGVPIAMLVLGDFAQLAAFSILMTFGIVYRAITESCGFDGRSPDPTR